MNDFSVSGEDMQHDINRSPLAQFWKALIAGRDAEAAQTYRVDAVVRLPQDGETIAGRANIAARGLTQPGERLVKINSIVGDGAVWVLECEARWRQWTTLFVSVAEMQDGTIIQETRYRVPKHVGSRTG
jgi:hypothetical protein